MSFKIRKCIPLLLIFIGAMLTACSANMNSPMFHNSAASGLASLETPFFNYDSSVWGAMRRNFQLNHHTDYQAVRNQINWYQHHPQYFYQIMQNARPYIYYMLEQTKKRHMPSELALLPVMESKYNPFAVSDVGAVGLWQMMPGTASGFGLKIDWWYDGRRDIISSTHAALNYLTYLHAFFNNNWDLAIAAYNSGEGTVQNAIQQNNYAHQPTDFWSLHLPLQTEAYVPELLALSAIVANPARYDLHLPPIQDEPFFGIAKIHSQIDLSEAAKLADVSLGTIHALNPGFRRWATDPTGPNRIILPLSHVARFERALASLPPNKRVTWRRHIVESGETLSSIALAYHTTVPLLREVNHLPNSVIYPEQSLLIPESAQMIADSRFRSPGATISEASLPGPKRVAVKIYPGETLWTVSQRFGVSLRQIRFWNNLVPNARLQPGDELTIWVNHRRPAGLPPYVFHQVTAGETLDQLALSYHSSLASIRTTNHLEGSEIHIGQVLKIPTNTAGQTSYSAQQSAGGVYLVQPGNNLSDIATQFHTSIDEIKRLNDLQTNNLWIGQKLRVPYHNEVTQDATAHRRATPRHLSSIYKVLPGDNLDLIAARYHVSVDAIKRENGLENDKLYVGEEIKIPGRVIAAQNIMQPQAARPQPIYYTIQSGDYLDKIAQAYHVTSMDLMRWNHIQNARDIHVGQRLIIYR